MLDQERCCKTSKLTNCLNLRAVTRNIRTAAVVMRDSGMLEAGTRHTAVVFRFGNFNHTMAADMLLWIRKLTGPYRIISKNCFNSFACRLRNLRRLDLSANGVLRSLEGISSLVHLEWLDASGNSLTEFGTELTSLHWLQHLSLSDNKITSLPDHFGQLG